MLGTHLLTFPNPKRFKRATLAYPGNAIAALREFLTSPPITGDVLDLVALTHAADPHANVMR